MNENLKIILKIISIPLALLFALSIAFGFGNLMNTLEGTNAYFNGGEDYCLDLFEQRYNKYPYDVGINPYGDCIYKLDYMQLNYVTLNNLKENGGIKNGN